MRGAKRGRLQVTELADETGRAVRRRRIGRREAGRALGDNGLLPAASVWRPSLVRFRTGLLRKAARGFRRLELKYQSAAREIALLSGRTQHLHTDSGTQQRQCGVNDSPPAPRLLCPARPNGPRPTHKPASLPASPPASPLTQ